MHAAYLMVPRKSSRARGKHRHASEKHGLWPAGIEQHGIVKTKDDAATVYAYEVDGFGNAVTDFDDPNLPSLLSIPLLGYKHYDPRIYEATKSRCEAARCAEQHLGARAAALLRC